MSSVSQKRCIACGAEKAANEFYIANKVTGRLSSRCKTCRVAQTDAYRKARPGLRSAEGKRRRQRHPNVDREYQQSDRAKANRGKRRGKMAEQSRRWRKENPSLKLAQKQRRRARIRSNGGSFTAAEWEGLKAAQQYTCLRCRQQEPQIRLVPDHIVPISKGGTSYISNIQGLCVACNNWKRAKTIDFRPTRE
jgi:5-methylcytosine-specific restriction endonuclease McrA